MIALVLFGSFFLLLVLDLPISASLALSSVLAILVSPDIHMADMAREMGGGLQTFFPFVAVPLFLFAGEIMNKSGLSMRLIAFAQAIVGHFRGGLSMVTCIASMLFGSISGSSSADAAAIGSITIPSMIKNGYSRAFATVLAGFAGTTGALIPPSVMLIILGVSANLKIERLFMAGIGPGLLVGFSLMFAGYIYARAKKIPTSPRASLRELWSAFRGAIFAFLISGSIIFGIKFGIFTATESALVALLLSIAAGVFVYRSLSRTQFLEIMLGSIRTTAMMGFLFAAAFLFAYVLSVSRIPTQVADTLISLSGGNKIALLLLVNLFLFAVGTFMDGGVAIIILAPVFMPLAVKLGMDKIHFGIMMVTNLVIGLMTPPVGSTLFVVCGISKATIAEVTPVLMKIMIVLLIIQLLVTFVPAVTLFIPQTFLK